MEQKNENEEDEDDDKEAEAFVFNLVVQFVFSAFVLFLMYVVYPFFR